MLTIRSFAALVALLTAGMAPALAADPIFPTASRIGLVPPPGFTVSQSFSGFENSSHNAGIVTAELPAEAYDDALKSLLETPPTSSGVTGLRKDVIETSAGSANMVVGNQESNGRKFRKWMMLAPNKGQDFVALVTVIIPDTAREQVADEDVRTALASLALRDNVPNEEILGSMPFRVEDTAQFKSARLLIPGRAVVLTDQDRDSKDTSAPSVIISVGAGSPSSADDRGRFAEQLLTSTQGYKDLRKVGAEPMRIGGMPGYEIRLEGKDANSDKDVSLVQWVRFGTQGFLRIVGVAPKEQWVDAFTRFRAVRDGIPSR